MTGLKVRASSILHFVSLFSSSNRKEELEKMSSREVVDESRRVRKERAAVDRTDQGMCSSAP